MNHPSPCPRIPAPVFVQPFLPLHDDAWIEVRDANDAARFLYHRHYSRKRYTDGRKPLKFTGPGEHILLVTPDVKAVFLWRKEKFRKDDQAGVNCAIFRNEGQRLSSDLIHCADEIAWKRWPGERLFTFVNPRKIRSSNPGFCFLKAGWRKCGFSKGGFQILEVLP